MCGRYSHRYTWRQLERLLSLTSVPWEFAKRYNVAPTQTAPVVRADGKGGRSADLLRWGLIPSWAKSAAIASSLVNARSETAHEQPAFRTAFRQRRCVVPVSGFYEWGTKPAAVGLFGEPAGRPGKQPYYLTSSDGEPLLLAGLWESWRDPALPPDAPPLETFTILTTLPNEMVVKIHDRMPAILDVEGCAKWLDLKQDVDSLRALLVPYPAELMARWPVSNRVNSPKHDDETCVQPLDE